MNSDESSKVCTHGRSDSISWMCLSIRIPELKEQNPLKRNPTWVCTDGLDDRPNKQYGQYVVDNQEDNDAGTTPRLKVKDKQFHDADVDKDYDG